MRWIFSSFDLAHSRPILFISIPVEPVFDWLPCSTCGSFPTYWTLPTWNSSLWNIRWMSAACAAFVMFFCCFLFLSDPVDSVRAQLCAKNVRIADQLWLLGTPLMLAWPSVVTEKNNLARVRGGVTLLDQIINTPAPAFEPALWGMKMAANERFLCSKFTLAGNIRTLSESSLF